MIATAFDEENCVLEKPESMTSDDCDALSVYRGISKEGFPIVISCWKFTKEELEEINKTGRLYLIMYGQTMPPVALVGISPWKK